MREIRFFIREEPHGFLSNFERTPIVIGSVLYQTNEHYYQSQKAINDTIRAYIMNAPNATIAMVLGRELEHNKYLKKHCKPNWEEIKLNIMLNGLRHKFKNLELREKLLATGNAILHENNPEDFYWAIADGTGKSMLGKLLMQVREEIRTKTIICAKEKKEFPRDEDWEEGITN